MCKIRALMVGLTCVWLAGPAWALEEFKPLTTLQAAAVATGNGTAIDVALYNSVAIDVSIATTATVTFEGTVDGSTWVSRTCVSIANTSGTLVASTTSSGEFQCNVAGLAKFRARISAWTSGAVTVTARATTADMAGGGGGGSGGTQYNEDAAHTTGDTVLITPGIYSTAGTNDRFMPVYNSYNSGSSGNPIIYRCTTAGGCDLRLSSGTGVVIGACGTGGGSCVWGAVDYITWDGFYVNEANAPSESDTGPVVFAYAVGGTIQNSTIDCNGDAGARNDNHNGVRIEKARGTTVRNNLISNCLNGPGNSDLNASGILNYNSDNLLIEHNEVRDSGGCIFMKDLGFSGTVLDPPYYQDEDITIRYNLCRGNVYGLIANRQVMNGSARTYWQQNIVHSCTGSGNGGILIYAFSVEGEEPMDGANQNSFVNNTINGCQRGVFMAGGPTLRDLADNTLHNNLITNSTDYHIYTEMTVDLAGTFETDRVLFERGWYWTAGSGFQRDTSTRTFAQWQSAYTGQDPNSTSGTDPQYTNAAAHNYHIANASALTAGRVVHSIGGTNGDTIPVGAYITGSETIGIEGETTTRNFAPLLDLRRAENDLAWAGRP